MARIKPRAGRDVLLFKGDGIDGERICARSKTLTIGNEPIDITQDCGGSFRRLMNEPSVRFIDMALEGLLSQDDWLTRSLDTGNGYLLKGYTLYIPSYGTISCDFAISNFELGAPHDGAVSFSATLQSSGKWLYMENVVKGMDIIDIALNREWPEA